MTEDELREIERDVSNLVPEYDTRLAMFMETTVPSLIAEVRRLKQELEYATLPGSFYGVGPDDDD